MPSFFEKIAARIAFWHARGVFRAFLSDLDRPEAVQERALARVMRLVRGSEYARQCGLDRVRSIADLRSAAPIVTYDDVRPTMDRLHAGDVQALFAPGTRLIMFATSSGTTAHPKYIPVTPEFVTQYRRGWNTFGLKMLSDHPDAVLRAILQGSGKMDESISPAGVPCGAITGLMSRTQKRIVRRFYVGTPEMGDIDDPTARYYTLMRFGIMRDVAFAITANPATLIRMARTADENRETLIRDVRDGTLSAQLVDSDALRRRLSSTLRPDKARAAELEKMLQSHGSLRPRDYWKLSFLACWTGGSMGYYLERLADWFGPLPVRDVGLLASEGRVTIPLDDGTPAGVLDVNAAVFEFIPIEEWQQPSPRTLLPTELEVDREYVVVLTNDAGLIRYRLDDVVKVRGWVEHTPVLEFLHRAGRVSSMAGEKLTEHQLVQAVRSACKRLAVPEFDFVVGPRWADPPSYVLSAHAEVSDALVAAIDESLGQQNFEYESRRKSNRLGGLSFRALGAGAIDRMDQRLMASRRSTSEQYKRPCLFTEPSKDTEALGLPPDR
ncbi:MAG: GH3 auxin-responsive promoter family protein [Phycisphaerae bacterium]